MTTPAPLRVMVVDDSPLQGALLRARLEARFSDEVEVEVFTDPRRAVEAMGPQYELILLDWEMPGMDGAEVLAEACRRGVDPKRIIVSSSHPAQRLHETFDETGCLAVIEKGEREQEAAFQMILDGLMRRHQRQVAAQDDES